MKKCERIVLLKDIIKNLGKLIGEYDLLLYDIKPASGLEPKMAAKIIRMEHDLSAWKSSLAKLSGDLSYPENFLGLTIMLISYRLRRKYDGLQESKPDFLNVIKTVKEEAVQMKKRVNNGGKVNDEKNQL